MSKAVTVHPVLKVGVAIAVIGFLGQLSIYAYGGLHQFKVPVPSYWPFTVAVTAVGLLVFVVGIALDLRRIK